MEGFKKAKTKSDIESDPRVESLERESEGSHVTWWCYLKSPFRYDDDLSFIHEPTIKEICTELNSKLVYLDESRI